MLEELELSLSEGARTEGTLGVAKAFFGVAEGGSSEMVELVDGVAVLILSGLMIGRLS